jgi:periplasmic mercuric ion binding protein
MVHYAKEINMVRLFALTSVVFAAAILNAQDAGNNKVEVKGPHICCAACVKSVNKILEKVDGVSAVVADKTTKKVTFTAKGDKSAQAGFKALVDGGFFGTATSDGKEIKLTMETLKKGDKADVVTVKDVHVCCGQCQNAIKKIFTGSTVSFAGDGAQRTVRIEGKGLDRAEVIETLHKTGFNGSLEK